MSWHSTLHIGSGVHAVGIGAVGKARGRRLNSFNGTYMYGTVCTFRYGIYKQRSDRTEERLEARGLYAAVTLLDPFHGSAYFNWGLLMEDEKPKGTPPAWQLFHAATVVDPTLSQAHHRLGLYYSKVCKLQEAEASFERALELQPGALHMYDDLAPVWWAGQSVGHREARVGAAVKKLETVSHGLLREGRQVDAATVAAVADKLKAGTGVKRITCV